MTGKYGCYRSPALTTTIFPAGGSAYAQRERAPVSGSARTLAHAAPTRGLGAPPAPAHPAASSRPPPAQPHHDCWHFPGSWVNRKPLKIYIYIKKKNSVSITSSIRMDSSRGVTQPDPLGSGAMGGSLYPGQDTAPFGSSPASPRCNLLHKYTRLNKFRVTHQSCFSRG